MTDLARIGTTTFTAMAAAFAALVGGTQPQLVEVLRSETGANAFGAINCAPEANIVVHGTVQPDGSLPELDAIGTFARLAWGKGIIDIEQANSVLIQNIGFANAATSGDSNGAAIRLNGNCQTLTLKNVRATNNENGVLGGEPVDTIIEDSVFDQNGQDSNASREGYSHNLYLDGTRAEVRRSDVTNSHFGHDLKSRAKTMVVEQAKCSGSLNGRAFDYANGGTLTSLNTAYMKPANAAQDNLIHLCAEGNPDGRPEAYSFTNDLFQIDIPANGRALQFICNDGAVEAVLTDPMFILNGVQLTDDQAKAYFAGKSPVRIVTTGGARGPLKAIGRDPNQQPIPLPDGVVAGVDAPVVAAPEPTPTFANDVVLLGGYAAGGSWSLLGKEYDTGLQVANNTLVRFGVPGAWTLKVESGMFDATLATFGGSDPAVGVQKQVQVYTPPAAVAVPAPVATTATSTATDPALVIIAADIAAMKAKLAIYGYTVTKNA